MIRAFQWDLAGQVERLDCLLALLPRYAAWGYQELYLHLEDAVHYPSLPGVARDDAYTYEQLGELVLTAARHGIRIVPVINLLGGTEYLIKHPDWRGLSELRDERDRPLPSGQVCPLHPRTLEVAERLLRDLVPYCSAGKVHVGLGDSFHLGQCPRCREEVARVGLGGHFANHVHRLHAIAGAQSLQLGMWADLLYFLPEAIPLLPRGITAYDRYDYPFAKQPRVELFNFAERDLLPALRHQGIAYYGCPTNGAFRHGPLPVFGDRLANIRSWWQRCAGVKADGFLITSREVGRLALETTTLVDAAAANLWLEPALDDATAMLARGLERAFGAKAARALARTLIAADEHAFAGHARWQINDRWDTFAGTESLKPYEIEERFFERLQTAGWPGPLAASLAFRHYLARRDVFVRQAAREIFRLRRRPAETPAGLKALLSAARGFALALKAGRKAARAMWAHTRDPRACGQNEAMLDADAVRLATWLDWLKRAAKNRALLGQATPVCGAWQLRFMVHNFAPALQKVIVEQQEPDGTWRELASWFTGEFRALAARPRSRLKREFTVPVDSPDARLRIAVRGVGMVAISHVALTNGVEIRRSRTHGLKKILGRRAPGRGLPVVDWANNVQALELPPG